MTSIDLETLLTIIYVLVDDWYQAGGSRFLKGKAGAKAWFSDSEMLTLMVAQDYIPYPGERQYIGYIRANYGHLFPHLVDASQYNRRGRGLRYLLEQMRQEWLQQLGIEAPEYLLLDTKPVPVVGYKRRKSHSDFAGSAGYGHCAARNLKYFGYKLVLLTTLDGLPLVYELVAANTDEHAAAEVVLAQVTASKVLGDKGFLGEKWQAEVYQDTQNRVWTMKRANQANQNPPEFDRLLGRLRERIEGTFHQLQNTGRNLERLLAKTVHGLVTRVIAKVTSMVLKYLLLRQFGVNVQSFQTISI